PTERLSEVRAWISRQRSIWVLVQNPCSTAILAKASFSGYCMEFSSRRGVALFRLLDLVPGVRQPRPFHEALQHAGPQRMLQLPERLGFDLAHPFPGHLEDLPDFLQRVAVAHAQPVAQLDDL